MHLQANVSQPRNSMAESLKHVSHNSFVHFKARAEENNAAGFSRNAIHLYTWVAFFANSGTLGSQLVFTSQIFNQPYLWPN